MTSDVRLLGNGRIEFSACIFDHLLYFKRKENTQMARRAPGEYISLPSNAAQHVDAYFEYRAWDKWEFNKKDLYDLLLFSIVGDDDGGTLFTPEEYESYKKRVLPMVRKKHGGGIFEWFCVLAFA